MLSWSGESLLPCRRGTHWTMPVLVCIFTAQILQDGRLTNIETQQTQSTPSVAADAEMDREALTTQLASNQRLVGASDPYDSSHQGELERHGGRLWWKDTIRSADSIAYGQDGESKDSVDQDSQLV